MDKCDLRHLEYYTDMRKKKDQENRRLKRDLKPCNVFEGIPKKEPKKGSKIRAIKRKTGVKST